jgi:cell wall assembly regulator SMI1
MYKNIYHKIVLEIPSALLHPDEGIPEGVNNDDIMKLEKDIGFPLPETLKQWLTVTNAPCVGTGGFIGISPKRKSLDIYSIYENYPNWKSHQWIPMANDGSGNFYVAVIDKSEVEAIGFIDTMENLTHLAFVVASDIIIFIKMFIMMQSGERRWPYNKKFVVEKDPCILNKRHIAPMPWQ